MHTSGENAHYFVARMRKEEIERFSKASNDAEFAKMMKSRTLDPEHLEIQTQLRRGIRVSLVVPFFFVSG